MAQRFNKFLDRLESRLALVGVLGGSTIAGGVSVWLSRGVDLINQFGWFGWWIAGLSGALLASLIGLALVWMRYAWVNARVKQKWQEQVSTFNPMDRDFRNLRLRAEGLMHPMTKAIENKRLYDCEILGPASIFFYSGETSYSNFADCNFVVLWPDENGNVSPGNSVIVVNTIMHSCKLSGVTILITPDKVQTFKEMGAKFATLTGDPEIDGRWHPDLLKETPR